MSLVEINWRPDRRETRRFAFSHMIGFILIAWAVWFFAGSWQATRQTGHFVWGPLPLLWGIPLLVGLVSLLGPAFARPFYLLWMALAWVIGTLVSGIVLALFYYLVVTPTGLLLRLFRYDPLCLRARPGVSGWVDRRRPYDRRSGQRMF